MFFTVQKALHSSKTVARCILTSSVSNVLGVPGFSAYAASKAAVRNFARAWTLELKDRKIRVNCMSPGAIDTPALATTDGASPLKQAEQAAAQSPPRYQWAAEACPRKSRQPSCSSHPMKVHISPAWISPSMGAWRRSSNECADQVAREIENCGSVRAVALETGPEQKNRLSRVSLKK